MHCFLRDSMQQSGLLVLLFMAMHLMNIIHS